MSDGRFGCGGEFCPQYLSTNPGSAASHPTRREPGPTLGAYGFHRGNRPCRHGGIRAPILHCVERIGVLRAAAILGCGRRRARTLLGQHGFIGGDQLHSTATLQDVEKLATSGYRWNKHTSDPHSYWVTSGQAAEILGLSTARIKQLAATGRLPFESHVDGTRLFRREQLITIANAAETRHWAAG